IIVTLLEPMARATLILSSSSHPTMGDLHLIFPTILNILYDAINSEIQIKSQIANEMFSWYSNEDICSANTDDSSRNYFGKHRNEKSKNNTRSVLEEYLTAIKEN
ncbi:32842_t:CDS:2, partial [Gigaspora margarita]